MTADGTALLDIARQAIAIGGDLLKNTRPGQVERKGDRDFVTDLDLRIQDEIRRYLADAAPEIEFLSEEVNGPQPDPETADAMWVLDPIDGTSNFIHGIPLSAVSLALVQGGAATVGVILAPFLGLEYFAIAGRGAYSNGHRMAASQSETLEKSIVSLGDYAVGANADRKNQRRVALTTALASSVERVRMFGSAALDLVWVAEGRTDACVILANKPWDTAAGVLIARESGARVTDSAGNSHSFASADTVAAAPSIADELLTLIDDIG
ncbi:inositol monophosphatase family protein [Nocardia uniformis]|uniref:inositol-phosphate phosphatase n=1 Tax=Nocardia uniformis TaxID=53432 RepID=A0A849BZR8_9NOCA|nr:inositol monophosphatase family protein [Nocardia uniformis]NNH72043.1 inositol monophosphatase family protein [Nocardia uniformis]